MFDLKSRGISYIGCYDTDLDLFESQYVVPKGVTYNSYVILDEKVAVMDTSDRRKTEEWMANLDKALDGRAIDYLVIQHMEPDHSAGIAILADKHPQMKLVGNTKTFTLLKQFTGNDYEGRKVTVGEGDTLKLGSHTLSFYMAPMVHWPEVMVTYDSAAKVLFSADGFGRFGSFDPDEEWVDEARRYYINIVGKYGMQVQSLLKKASGLDIEAICPLHGPVLSGDAITLAVEKYDLWDSYHPEEKGVLLAYSSIHGNTAKAALEMADTLRGAGLTVEAWDLTRQDWAGAIAGAFRYSGLLLMSSSYNAGVFTPMAQFLYRLRALGFRDRVVGLVENGSWAPSAIKTMMTFLDDMKALTILEPRVTIRSTPTDEVNLQMKRLCAAFLNKLR